jgi:acid phosphatase
MGKLVWLFCLALTACATGPQPESLIKTGMDHPGHHATLWASQSAERDAITRQTYRAALKSVDEALSKPRWTALPIQAGFPGLVRLKNAVLLDVDETVLDNSAYQSQNIATGRSYPDGWDDWVKTQNPPAIPGAIDFLKALEKRRITPVFTTNRTCADRSDNPTPCPQQADTIRALITAGVPGPISSKDILLKGEEKNWGSDKTTRRLSLVTRYRILAIIGDDLADFLPAVQQATPAQRRDIAAQFEHLWGDRWFLLPNPVYGSFLDSGEGPEDK